MLKSLSFESAPDSFGFSFSDARRIIAEATLDNDIHRLCLKPDSFPVDFIVAVLLWMVALMNF